MNETDHLNYLAAQAIQEGNYHKAIQAIADGSGDLHVMALLVVASEMKDALDFQKRSAKGYPDLDAAKNG